MPASVRLSTELSRFASCALLLIRKQTRAVNALSLPLETLACCQTLSPRCSRKTNSGRPYRRFVWKSRLFHHLARKNRTQICHAVSRIDAAHARIVGHAVNGQHVGRRARVNAVLIG